MVQFTLPNSAASAQTEVSPANAAAVHRLMHGPYPNAQLGFTPGRSERYLHRLDGEIGLARAVARYLTGRLVALETFTVGVPLSAVRNSEPVETPKDEEAHHPDASDTVQEAEVAPPAAAAVAAPSDFVQAVPNRFQLAVSVVKGTLRTAYPDVCADVFVAEAARVESHDARAYATLSIAEMVLCGIAGRVGDAVFGGALCAMFAHGVSLWSAEALHEAQAQQKVPATEAGISLRHDVANSQPTHHITLDGVDEGSHNTDDVGHRAVVHEKPKQDATTPPRSVAQACWSLHRTAVHVSVAAFKLLAKRREATSAALSSIGTGAAAVTSADATGAPQGTASPQVDSLCHLCTSLHHLLSLLHFLARVGHVPSLSWNTVETLQCVYTIEDVQYLLQMPLPLPPLHADMTANLKEQSAVCSMLRTALLEMVERISLTEWKWVNMKTSALLKLLQMFYAPEEVFALEQFVQWCNDYDELARSVLRDKLSIPALFKVEKVIESRVLAVPLRSLDEESTRFMLYPVDAVQAELRAGKLRTAVDKKSDLAAAAAVEAGVRASSADDGSALADNGEVAPAAASSASGQPGANAAPVTVDPVRRQFVGLVNAGNTCFVNSVVQLLFRCRPFVCALVRATLQTLTDYTPPPPLRLTQQQHHEEKQEEEQKPPLSQNEEEEPRTTTTTSVTGVDQVQHEDARAQEPRSPLQLATFQWPVNEDGATAAADAGSEANNALVVKPGTRPPPGSANLPSVEVLAAHGLATLEAMMAAAVRGASPRKPAPGTTATADAGDTSDLRTLVALVLLLGEMNWRIYMDHAATTSIDMRGFLNALPELFRDGQQHDASEFCKMLLELLDRSERQWGAATAQEPTQEQTSSASAAPPAPAARSLVETWFGGCMQTDVRCRVCQDVRSSNSAFWDLSLVVPKTKDTTNMDPTRAAVAAAGVASAGTAPPLSWGSTHVGPDAGALIPYTAAAAAPSGSILKKPAQAPKGETQTHEMAHTSVRAQTVYADGETATAVREDDPVHDNDAVHSVDRHEPLYDDEGEDGARGGSADAGDVAEAPLESGVLTPHGERSDNDSSHSRSNSNASPVSPDGGEDFATMVPILDDPIDKNVGCVSTQEPIRTAHVSSAVPAHDVPSAAAGAEAATTTTTTTAEAEVDPRTVTIQHLLWQTADPQLNVEVLTGDNQLRCTTCDARTDTELSTVVLAETDPACASEAAASSSSSASSLLALSARGVPHFLTLQLQRFAFDRTSLSFGKLLQPVVMEEVVLLPVATQAAPVRTRAATPLARDEEETAEAPEAAEKPATETTQSIAYVPFRLSAILIHSGTTPYSGHYYSIVRHDAGSAAQCLMTAGERDEREKKPQEEAAAPEPAPAHGSEGEAAARGDVPHAEPEARATIATPPVSAAEKAAAERDAILTYANRLAHELEAQRRRRRGDGDGDVTPVLDPPFDEESTQLPEAAVGAKAGETPSTSTSAPSPPPGSAPAVTLPFLGATADGLNVTGHATEGWVMVNDSHVMSIEPKRMIDVLQGKRGVYSALETAYVLLYERVGPAAAPEPTLATAATSTRVEDATALPALPDFSDDVLTFFGWRAVTGAAPPTAKLGSEMADVDVDRSYKSNGANAKWNGKNSYRYYDDPHDGVAMGRPFAFFDTGTAGY